VRAVAGGPPLSDVDQKGERVIMAEHLDWEGPSGLWVRSELEDEDEMCFLRWQSR
jgi:hypothetical protein